MSRLPGARLMFRHVITDLEDGAVRVDVTVSMTGPFSRLWRLAMGKGLRTSLPRDLAGLVAAVQQDGKRADAESA